MNSIKDEIKRYRLPLLILGLLLALPLYIRSPFILTTLIMFFYYAYSGVCWNWIGGYAGQINLAHGAFLGIGAYTTAILFIELRLTPWIGMFIGAILAAAIAFVIGKYTFRYKIRGFYFALVTLAITEIFRHVVSSFKITGGTVGLYLPLELSWYALQFKAREPYYYIMLSFLVIVVSITIVIEKSKIGYYLIAIREDEESAASIGINTEWYKNFAFCISAAFSSLAGALSVQLFWYVDPETGFSLEIVFYTILIVILGGRGTVWGPILGALVLTALGEGFRCIPAGSQEIAAITKIVYASILIITIIFLKRGIAEMFGTRKVIVSK